jgi:hypothetical protein
MRDEREEDIGAHEQDTKRRSAQTISGKSKVDAIHGWPNLFPSARSKDGSSSAPSPRWTSHASHALSAANMLRTYNSQYNAPFCPIPEAGKLPSRHTRTQPACLCNEAAFASLSRSARPLTFKSQITLRPRLGPWHTHCAPQAKTPILYSRS